MLMCTKWNHLTLTDSESAVGTTGYFDGQKMCFLTSLPAKPAQSVCQFSLFLAGLQQRGLSALTDWWRWVSPGWVDNERCNPIHSSPWSSPTPGTFSSFPLSSSSVKNMMDLAGMHLLFCAINFKTQYWALNNRSQPRSSFFSVCLCLCAFTGFQNFQHIFRSSLKMQGQHCDLRSIVHTVLK